MVVCQNPGQKHISKPSSSLCPCGAAHLVQDHWKFLADMRSEPVDLIDDLVKMGVYQSPALSLAETLTHAELRKSLMLRLVADGDSNRQWLCNELIKQAGGLDQAFAAAFGLQATQFFSEVIKR